MLILAELPHADYADFADNVSHRFHR